MTGEWPDTPVYPWPLWRCRNCRRELPYAPGGAALVPHLDRTEARACPSVPPHPPAPRRGRNDR